MSHTPQPDDQPGAPVNGIPAAGVPGRPEPALPPRFVPPPPPEEEPPPAEEPPAPGGRRRKRRGDHLSAVLARIAADRSLDRIALSHLMDIMRGRAFGALLIIFAFPNVLPSPPGLAGILGLPLLFLSVQMAIGTKPWLPKTIGNRSMPRESFASLIDRAMPWLQRAERLTEPRWIWLASRPAQRLLGVLCVIVTVLLMLPVPFGNMAPSLALVVIGLGLLERDGLWILIGVIMAIGASIWVSVLAYALVKSAIYVFLNAF